MEYLVPIRISTISDYSSMYMYRVSQKVVIQPSSDENLGELYRLTACLGDIQQLRGQNFAIF